MPRLPVVKPRELIKVLQKKGFTIDHVTGSHHILYNSDGGLRANVPYHNKPLKRKTLTSILKSAQISIDELRELL